MSTMLCIIDTHPVQYRAPLYQELARKVGNSICVFYGSDFSVKGYLDADFGQQFAWDVPLLAGYHHAIAGSGSPHSILSCLGVIKHLWCQRPRAVLLTDVHRPLFWTAYATALLLGIDLWLRTETQDEAYERNGFKEAVRGAYYRVAYLPLKRVFYIGELNRSHYERHGVATNRLFRSPYATRNPLQTIPVEEKCRHRAAQRRELGIEPERIVVAFFGKLIPKKNPDLLFDALNYLHREFRRGVTLLFVGSGKMEQELQSRGRAEQSSGGAQVVYAGFVNQSKLPDYYLAADVVVLPSRRAGETWGLVVNEALGAGCGVVVSRAVGCSVEFADWERVDLIEVGDAAALARALERQRAFIRDYEWAFRLLANYSIERAALGIVQELPR